MVKTWRMRHMRQVALVGEIRNSYKIFVEKKTEGKRSFGRHRRKWEDIIKLDFKEIANINKQ
jgi:hypothetical protein